MTPEPGEGCWKSLRDERCESPTLALGRNQPLVLAPSEP
jgi:hypothetical protein